MPEQNPRIPQISVCKGSQQAILRLSRNERYLGPWGSDQAKSEYTRIVGE